MFDEIPLQRSDGTAHIALQGGRIAALRQSGSAKVMLPRTHSAAPEIVFLNTSGGLTAGDRLDYGVQLGAGMRAGATTQTAERAYRAEGGRARARVTLELGPGASLTWLPQETILFDGSALSRQTCVSLAADAWYLGVETVILGRAAMGEQHDERCEPDEVVRPRERGVRRREQPAEREREQLVPSAVGSHRDGEPRNREDRHRDEPGRLRRAGACEQAGQRVVRQPRDR